MDPKTRKRLRLFGIQMLIYGTLVVIYLYLIWRYLERWLVWLYQEDLPLYAVISLAFIVLQAVVLDTVTTVIMKRLGLTEED